MRFWWLSILISLLGGLTACQNLVNEVNPDKLGKIDTKLVVNGYISPQDTLLVVAVSHSQPVLGVDTSGLNLVSNATVILSDGTQSITLPYDPKQHVYAADAHALPIVAGKTYQLQVSVSGFATVTATCTVPSAIPLASILLDSTQGTTRPDGVQTFRYYVRARWQDPAGETDFYRVAGRAKYVGPGRPKDNSNDTAAVTGVYWAPIGFGRSEQYVSDRNQDGLLMASSRVELPDYYSFTDSNNDPIYSNDVVIRPLTILIDVLHTDETYYNYHYAVQQQRSTGSNPFAEPVLVPSNIVGGLGCFAAYNRTSLTTVLR